MLQSNIRWASYVKVLLASAALTLSWGHASRAQTTSDKDEIDKLLQASTHAARISSMAVSSPTGRLLLVRKGSSFCAVKFEGFKRERNRTDPSTFSSGEETFRAKYELFLLSEAPDGKVVSRDSHMGSLRRGASVGIGRLSMNIGSQTISCGATQVLWAFPARLVFITGTASTSMLDDRDLQLAPSAWTSIDQVDLRKVTWYRLDETRKPRQIAVDDLPK